jgi:hypothetical protein
MTATAGHVSKTKPRGLGDPRFKNIQDSKRCGDKRRFEIEGTGISRVHGLHSSKTTQVRLESIRSRVLSFALVEKSTCRQLPVRCGAIILS